MKTLALTLMLSILAASPLLLNAAPADAARARAEVAPLLADMSSAANAHDVEGHVGLYSHDPSVALIFNGVPIVGWEAIRDKQRESWKPTNAVIGT